MSQIIRLEIKNLCLSQILASKIYKLNWFCKLKSTLKLDFRGLNIHSRILKFTTWVDFEVATSSNNTKKCTNFPSNFLFHISLWELHPLWTTICNIFMFFWRGFVVECLQGIPKKLHVIPLTISKFSTSRFDN